MDNCFLIGWGMVGKATSYALKIPRENCIDRSNKDAVKPADCYILCLPTPTENGKQDISSIEEWMLKIRKLNKHALIILRSTVLPGTTEKLIKKYKLNIIFVPEFLTESSAISDSENPEFMVVGTNDILLKKLVYDIFYPYIDTDKWIMCSPTTAEMIKYAMNMFFTMKVLYGNQMWDLCAKNGADYSKLKEALEFHKWGSKNGWDVWHGGYRGAGGSCLFKDLDALANFSKLPLLETMNKINKELLKGKK